MPTNVRDPRSIITPDAFRIDPALLGTPLARPRSRLIALVIDIAVIGLLNVFTTGFGPLIWGIVGAFLLYMAFRPPSEKLGQVTSVLFRGSTGCLGILILGLVLLVGTATFLSDEMEDGRGVSLSPAEALSGLGRLGALRGLAGLEGLGEVESIDEARRRLTPVLTLMDDLGLEEDDQAAALEELIGPDPAFTDDPDAFIESMLAANDGEAAPGPDEERPPLDPDARSAILALPDPQVLERYMAGLEAGRDPASDAEFALIRDRAVAVVAGDSLGVLRSLLEEEREDRERAQERAQDALENLAARDTGFTALLRDIWDQAGSALGLWSIYFTLALTLFKGFTVGKRIMGIRVIRLDGEPINWWAAFERAGGYVAGIATGLLGFAQIYWDPNRQCVHDKIGGTAVVVAGAKPIAGAVESSWQDSPDSFEE